MSHLLGYIEWFFYNTGTYWVSAIFCILICLGFFQIGFDGWAKAAAIAGSLLIVIAVGFGIFNLTQVEVCDKCGKVLPAGANKSECACKIELDPWQPRMDDYLAWEEDVGPAR